VQTYQQCKRNYQQHRLPRDRREALKVWKPAKQILREDRNPTHMKHDTNRHDREGYQQLAQHKLIN
jgi:hypothetical protein